MIPALSVALTAQNVLSRKLESIASNVANSSTVGYRADQIHFEELLSGSMGSSMSFPSSGSLSLSKSGGQIVKTDGPFDLAVQGDGWFAVQTDTGRAYTRDGRFMLSPGGDLVTLKGDRVLDVGGGPLAIDPDGVQPRIARDGMITQGTVQVGAIGLFRVDSNSGLLRKEGALVTSDRPADPITSFVRDGVQSGFLENSNVAPVSEISSLIAVQRMFAVVTNGLEAMESNVDQAIKMLGPTS